MSSGTWWVYTLGFIYTIFRVEVPYLPTPKRDQPRNNFILCLPNLLMLLLTVGLLATVRITMGGLRLATFIRS
ncbi:hypothetical protein [Spirosoma telluris]|uniref:hypothetical protein n=1 Tax=Spirosoma telluris TaxID=2183553 RepID=UPI002FC31F6A